MLILPVTLLPAKLCLLQLMLYEMHQLNRSAGCLKINERLIDDCRHHDRIAYRRGAHEACDDAMVFVMVRRRMTHRLCPSARMASSVAGHESAA